MSILSVYMTASSQEEAEKIAHALIERKLAACVNIFPVQSIYRYEGAIHEDKEVVMIAKSRLEQFEYLKNLVKDLHSYSCPCIVAHPITHGYQPYLGWVIEQTT